MFSLIHSELIKFRKKVSSSELLLQVKFKDLGSIQSLGSFEAFECSNSVQSEKEKGINGIVVLRLVFIVYIYCIWESC